MCLKLKGFPRHVGRHTGFPHDKSRATEEVYTRGAGLNTNNRAPQITERIASSYNKHLIIMQFNTEHKIA